MKNSGRCGISNGIEASAPSAPRLYIVGTRAFCAEPIRKPVSAMPSGWKMLSRK